LLHIGQTILNSFRITLLPVGENHFRKGSIHEDWPTAFVLTTWMSLPSKCTEGYLSKTARNILHYFKLLEYTWRLKCLFCA